jgi:hypothetical protein
MRSGPAPVTGVWNSEGRIVGDSGRDEHSLIAREHRLAKRDNITGIVLDTNVARRRLAIGLARERFRDVAVLVTIQTAVLVQVSNNPCTREDEQTIDLG